MKPQGGCLYCIYNYSMYSCVHKLVFLCVSIKTIMELIPKYFVWAIQDRHILSVKNTVVIFKKIKCIPLCQSDAPSKSVVRPYKRPTAQEVCYQRMQMAQQQVAQLSASVKAASQISSPSSSGERKRIAHRPNPMMSSSKTSMNTSTIFITNFSSFLFYF